MFERNKVSPMPASSAESLPEIEADTGLIQRYMQQSALRKWTPHLKDRIRRRTEAGSLTPLERKSKTQQKCAQIKRLYRELIYKIEPWEESVKVIEGHHGSGVASYFLFLRWCVYVNLWFFILLFGLVTVPQIAFETKDYNVAVLGINSSYVHVNASNRCSQLYKFDVTYTENVTKLIMNVLQGTGWMEKTPLFYGFYEAKEMNTDEPYSIPLAYLLVCIACLLYSVIMMAKKSASNFHDSVYDVSPSSRYQFFSLIFLSWDYTMTNAHSAKLKQKSLKKQIISELADKQLRLKQKNRTPLEYARIIFIRVVINIFVLLCLGAGAYLIYYVTQYTTLHAKLDTFSSQHGAIQFVVEYLPSITISILNGVIPILFSVIIIVEDYLPQNEVMITLVRTILLRLASLIFLIASLYKEVMCKPKDECNVGTEKCSLIRCWETYIGQQFYKLVIMDLLITLILSLVVEPLMKFLSKYLTFIKPQFNVPTNVLDLVYTQSLSWLGFFFAPLIPLMVLLKLIFTFYLKKLSAIKWCSPFERPYKASKSQSLFATVLMISFFFCCLPIGYIICYVPPSRSCGPFRLYSNMYDILTITVELWPLSASMIVRFISSSAFILTIIVILILFLYYCAQRGSAQNDSIKLLTSQLNMERKEKYYFMVEVNNLMALAAETKETSRPSTQR